MTDEAKLVEFEGGGRMPGSEGWFVLNVADARWRESRDFGHFCEFEGADVKFAQLGFHLHVLEPGQPACLYHSETMEEAFLVLHGECLLVIEDQERPLKTWDLVRCPPGARHVFVGAGDGPCAIWMMGARGLDKGLRYPVSDVAARHGASVTTETTAPPEAYAGRDWGLPVAPRWPL